MIFSIGQIASGDMDLPAREELGERRRKHEVQRIPLHPDDSDDANEQGHFQLEEDEFYQQAKCLKVAKLAAKQKTNLRQLIVLSICSLRRKKTLKLNQLVVYTNCKDNG